MLGGLIRVGETVINLDNVLAVDLNWQDEGDPEHKENKVVFEFAKGDTLAGPYLKIFSGAEAEAIRRHLKKRCPDLLAEK